MLTCLAAAVCVCARVFFREGPPLGFHLLAPRLGTRQPSAPIHPTCFARRTRYETDNHDRPETRVSSKRCLSWGGPDKLIGPRSWAMGGHLAAIMTGGELWSWRAPRCCGVKTQTGGINAWRQKTQGHVLDAERTEWHEVSIFFRSQWQT